MDTEDTIPLQSPATDVIERKRALTIFLAHPDKLWIPTRGGLSLLTDNVNRAFVDHQSVFCNDTQPMVTEEQTLSQATTHNGDSVHLTQSTPFIAKQYQIIPICSNEFQFNNVRNPKEMAQWWIEHPAAQLWPSLLLARTHKFPGDFIALRYCNTYKKLHNYKTLGMHLMQVGEEEFDRLLRIDEADSYHILADCLALIRGTRIHQELKKRNFKARKLETQRRNVIKKADIALKKAEKRARNQVEQRAKRKRTSNVDAVVRSITEREVRRNEVEEEEVDPTRGSITEL
jgi:hypothetical protein